MRFKVLSELSRPMEGGTEERRSEPRPSFMTRPSSSANWQHWSQMKFSSALTRLIGVPPILSRSWSTEHSEVAKRVSPYFSFFIDSTASRSRWCLSLMLLVLKYPVPAATHASNSPNRTSRVFPTGWIGGREKEGKRGENDGNLGKISTPVPVL